jgi:tetratricopeptide (TPR) repeat protein
MDGRQERFEQLMNQGHSAAWEQGWERAAAYYRQALEEIPDNPKAVSNLALAFYELQDFRESFRYYQTAVKLAPDDPVPMERMGVICEQMGSLDQAANIYMRAAELYAKTRDLNKAFSLLNKVVDLAPENLTAHSRLAQFYERRGRKEPAVKEYLIIASLLQKSGEKGKAVQALSHVLKVFPDSEEAAKALAAIKAGQSLPRLAATRAKADQRQPPRIQQLEAPREAQDQESEPDPVTATRRRSLEVLAELLFDQDIESQETQSGRRGLGEIVKGVESADSKSIDHTRLFLHLSQAVDLQARGDEKQAREELERAIESGLDQPAAEFNLGVLLFDEGLYELSVRHLARSMKHADYALGSRLLIGQAQEKLENLAGAAVEYLEALRVADSLVAPEDQAEELHQMYEPLIEAQSRQEDPQEIVRLNENVKQLLLKTGWRESLRKARQQLPLSGGEGPPLPLAEILTETKGSQVVESINKIHHYKRQGLYRTAMEEAFYALQYAPTYLPLHTYIGELLQEQDRYQAAVDKYSAVAHSYSMRGEPKRAVEMLYRIISLSPMDMAARRRLIDQLAALGKLEDALDEYINLAEMYCNMADLSSARSAYIQALQMLQNYKTERHWKVQILHRMADIDLQSLDWREAVRVFEQIRSLQPEDEKARLRLVDLQIRLGQKSKALAELDNYISYLWSNGLKESAISFLETLVVEIPRQAPFHRRLAELNRLLKKIPQAIIHFDETREILVETGDRAGAIEVTRALLALNPPNASEYQLLLNDLKNG